MEKQFGLSPADMKADDPSEQVLLDVIQRNVQRLPVNDNASLGSARAGDQGLAGAVTSAVAFGGIFLIGIVLMLVSKLTPASKDSHY